MRTIGLLALVLLLPVYIHAAVLININTADAELLDTLPGIGSVIAGRIIDYRKANGPFVTIEDIQKVSGIGSGSTYAKIAPLITVDNTSAPVDATSSASTTESTAAASGSATYTPPPSSLSVQISGASNVVLEVPLHLTARATTKGGVTDPTAQISWGFGDGSFSSGTSIEKTYHYAGTYLVMVHASDGQAEAYDELTVTVKPANVSVSSISGEGITLTNSSKERLDLSNWHLSSEMGFFRIPEGTVLLPQASVLFPFSITNLPRSPDVALAYPDGIIAARLMPVAISAQLPEQKESSYTVQTVKPVPTISISAPAHDTEAVNVPTAVTESAAVGAALPASGISAAKMHMPALLRSPWTLGFLGVMAIAGGAFILL